MPDRLSGWSAVVAISFLGLLQACRSGGCGRGQPGR